MTDTPLDGVLLEDDFLDAARTLRDNAATRARIDAEDAHAKEILAKVLTDGETGVDADGTPLVKMKPGNLVWNDEAAAANLPADVLPRVTVVEPAHMVEVPREAVHRQGEGEGRARAGAVPAVLQAEQVDDRDRMNAALGLTPKPVAAVRIEPNVIEIDVWVLDAVTVQQVQP